MDLLAFLTTEATSMRNSILEGIDKSRSEVLKQMQQVSDNLLGDVHDLIGSFSAMELYVKRQLAVFRQSVRSLTNEARRCRLEVSLRDETPELMKIRQKIHKIDLITTNAQTRVMDSLSFFSDAQPTRSNCRGTSSNSEMDLRTQRYAKKRIEVQIFFNPDRKRQAR